MDIDYFVTYLMSLGWRVTSASNVFLTYAMFPFQQSHGRTCTTCVSRGHVVLFCLHPDRYVECQAGVILYLLHRNVDAILACLISTRRICRPYAGEIAHPWHEKKAACSFSWNKYIKTLEGTARTFFDCPVPQPNLRGQTFLLPSCCCTYTYTQNTGWI